MNEKYPHTPGNENEPNQQEHPSHEAAQQPSPKVYVASLADYNNGVLHGVWIDAARDQADIQSDIDAMLAESKEPGAEEFAIHDYGDFGVCQIHEFDSIELVSRIARGIKEHGYAFAAWAEVNEGSPERFDDSTRPISATSTRLRTTPTISLTISAIPTNCHCCQSRSGATCASTPRQWGETCCPAAISMHFQRQTAACGSSEAMLKPITIISAKNYSGELLFTGHICVVELSLSIELIQQFIVQWEVQKETILMTPQQTVQLMNLLANKRKALSLSVAEVGQRAGVDGGTVWRIEQGMIASPKAESLQAIGNVLGIPSIDLYAIVGWIPSGELPSLGPYLRAKYPKLPEEALHEIEAVTSKYGIDSDTSGVQTTNQEERSQ